MNSLKITGVTLCSNISMQEHVPSVISSSAQSLYALRVLRSHRFDASHCRQCSKLQSSRSSNIPPQRGGVHKRRPTRPAGIIPSEDCQSRLPQKQLTNTECYMRGSRWQVLPQDHNESMPSTPPTSATKNVPSYDLRPRTHQYQLPDKRDSLVACNYMIRMLYK